MRIAVISDTHDNLPNFKKAVEWIEKEKIKMIVHCGDVCSAGTLKEAIENFSGRVHLVFGNVDETNFCPTENDFQKSFLNVIFHKKRGEIKTGKKKIAFVHFPELARELAASRDYDLVFYGHTHKPWQEKIKNCLLINPGNLAGLFYQATFAVYNSENNKLELKIMSQLNLKK